METLKKKQRVAHRGLGRGETTKFSENQMTKSAEKFGSKGLFSLSLWVEELEKEESQDSQPSHGTLGNEPSWKRTFAGTTWIMEKQNWIEIGTIIEIGVCASGSSHKCFRKQPT